MSTKKLVWVEGNILISYFIFYSAVCFAQQIEIKKDQYIVSEEKKLQIVVHIWGEINRPGQYIVPDGTNVQELISIAGGPTEYSNLSNIKLTRQISNLLETHQSIKKAENIIIKKKIIKINLNNYLEKELSESIPILQPGDVVKVNRNIWSKWQTFIRIMSQLAIIVQGMYFYNRIVNE